MRELERLADPAAWEDLAAALTPWLASQRWFAGKARQVHQVTVGDAAILDDEDASFVLLCVLLDVAYAEGVRERYQVPLVEAPGAGHDRVDIAGIRVVDAGDEPAAMRLLTRVILDGLHRKSIGGALIHGEPLGPVPELADEQARRLGVEQSNTSFVLGDRVIVKLFRKLEEGLNPDVELTRGLTEHGFSHVPAQHGALLRSDDAGTTALAVAAEFLGRAREGWAVAVDEAEAVRSGDTAGEGVLLPQAAALGAVVARMHLTLREAFDVAAAPADTGQSWVAGMREQAERVLALAQRSPVDAARGVLALGGEIRSALEAPQQLADLGSVMRIHGDLHLGQVLLDEQRGWIVLDFEGEPARSLAERRLPGSPLRDVAGMLRSFDYAAAHRGTPTPALERWRDALRDAFLDAYLGTVAGTGLLPDVAEDRDALLVAFELDKAVYELGYELANRPDWVGIPAGGIRRLLGTADREE